MDMKDMFKKGKKVDPETKSAKLGVLKDLRSMASGMMGDDVKGLKKVTVAAPDKGDLVKGLDKAKDLIGGSGDETEPEGEVDNPEEEGQEKDKLNMAMDKCKEDPSMENMQELMDCLKMMMEEKQGKKSENEMMKEE